MFRVAYKLKPFIFYIVFSIVRGFFISKNKLTPGVVAQTYNIAKTFVIFIDMFGGLLIFIYCYCLKFVVSVLPQKLFGGF